MIISIDLFQSDLPGAFMYVNGSAGTNSTYRANLRAFEKYSIVPRMLRNATSRNLEVSFVFRTNIIQLCSNVYTRLHSLESSCLPLCFLLQLVSKVFCMQTENLQPLELLKTSESHLLQALHLLVPSSKSEKPMEMVIAGSSCIGDFLFIL
jgi:hypothetical protein